MGTLKVDNLQTRGGTALITNGAATTNLVSTTTLKNADMEMVKLSTQTASGASSVEFGSSVITTDYEQYVIKCTKLIPSATANLYMQLAPDNNSTYDGANYYSGYGGFGASDTTGSTGASYVSNGAQWNMGNAILHTPTAKSKQDITIRLINPMDSAIYTTAYTDVVKYYSGGNHYWFPLVHQHQDASAFNSFKLYMSSGTLSGRFTVYGVQV
tara:strand:+ start:288 stop:926 length:639 start_codon:yes stop_codon:yes gene_type:complete